MAEGAVLAIGAVDTVATSQSLFLFYSHTKHASPNDHKTVYLQRKD